MTGCGCMHEATQQPATPPSLAEPPVIVSLLGSPWPALVVRSHVSARVEGGCGTGGRLLMLRCRATNARPPAQPEGFFHRPILPAPPPPRPALLPFKPPHLGHPPPRFSFLTTAPDPYPSTTLYFPAGCLHQTLAQMASFTSVPFPPGRWVMVLEDLNPQDFQIYEVMEKVLGSDFGGWENVRASTLPAPCDASR